MKSQKHRKVVLKNSFCRKPGKQIFTFTCESVLKRRRGKALKQFYEIIVSNYYYKYCLVLLILKKYDIIQTGSQKETH